jgi:hypothetical protein
MHPVFRSATVLIAVATFLISGSGMPAAPQPPSLKLPEQVKDLTASRIGDEVHLHWTMPKRTTDKVKLEGDQRVHVCRKLENGPCESAGDVLRQPEKPAEFTDDLPAVLASGSPKLLTYVIELQNHARKTVGPSNSAYTAAGSAPAAVTGFAAEVVREGIVLRWNQGTAAMVEVMRLNRTLLTKPEVTGSPSTSAAEKTPTGKTPQSAGAPAPEFQRLEVDLPVAGAASAGSSSVDAGKTLDRDAAFDNSYRYVAERVAKLTVGGHVLELIGVPSDPITVDVRDVFAPHTPVDLAAVPDSDAHAIDLSWSPNAEADLAGYVVYRRDASAGMQPVRISPPGATSVAPSFRDVNAQVGQRYAYSVSAVDRDGNESARSTEIEEELPQQ